LDDETVKIIEDFQTYYKLEITGEPNDELENKVDSLINSPLQNGFLTDEAKVIKEKLVELGFADWENPNRFFGSETEDAVKYFQSYYGLVNHGIVDTVTEEKIDEVLNSPVQRPNRNEESQEVKEQLVFLGFADWDDPNDYFG
uniref:peptidoglycan-binding domain-containing protein n=1 Tax=Alkalibacillus haloalkaliphilus TaxID=94136 RepID=UPI00058F7FA0